LPRRRTPRNNVVVPPPLELNPEQRAAVEHGEGPLLVIAGPGSGKTRVITERIVYLLERGWAQPENILALTYTDKAAAEMSQRVRIALPDLENYPCVSTFHAFCYKTLGDHSFGQQLLDEIDLWIFLRRRLRLLNLEHYEKLAEPGAFLHDLNEFFSRCTDELVEPDDFAAYVGGLRDALSPHPDSIELQEVEKKEELARVFRRSRELLDEAGCSSFGSLMSETLRLWERKPQVLAGLQERFRYVLVDEFQDSNYAQSELLRRLLPTPRNITAVGDDDQAIYRFRGASHGAFEMFDQSFPGHRTIYLNRNYRSTRKVLRASQSVIERNEGRYSLKPPLCTENPEGARVALVESPDGPSEAAWVAGEIERLARQGTRLVSMAVLYRSHLHRECLVAELRRRSIPFNIRGLSILKTAMVRDLVAYLHLIDSPHHNVSLTRVLLSPRWRFPEVLAREARLRSSQNRSSICAAICALGQTQFAADLQGTGWGELQSLLSRMREVAGVATMPVLFDRLMDALEMRPAPRDRDYLKAFRKFLEDWQKKHEAGSVAPLDMGENEGPRSALHQFIDYFSYFLDAGGQIEAPEPPDAAKAVQMMTVHAAKGLEFHNVFVLSVARQRFPTTERKPVITFPEALRKGPAAPAGIHLQEERRLFYVAMTRACERLYLSSLNKQGRKPSTFVEDLLSNPVVATQDVERIKAPATEPESAAVRAFAEVRASHEGDQPTRAPISQGGNPQGNLFPEEPTVTGLHPNLAEWARLPIANDLGKSPALSATGIETYRTCPLKFKLQNVLRIRTEPQGMLTFGAVMHETVRNYLRLRQLGMPSFEEVERYYRLAWKDTGFEDDYHSERMKRGGLEQLRKFVALHNARPAPDHLATEQAFSFEVHGVKVQGRIDQIHALNHGAPSSNGSPAAAGPERELIPQPPGSQAPAPAGPEVELIDYKTGRPKTQKDADTSLQLSVYALAARQALDLRPVRLTFYNLSNNEAVTSFRTVKDLEDVMAEIHDVAEAIREERFEPAPGFACRRCDYQPICPAQEES
jgi:DNA helicase-2/ATP-dependent DNA helicase PcrA